MANAPKDHDELTEEEIERRRDKIARRMLNTPPKPRSQKTIHQGKVLGVRGFSYALSESEVNALFLGTNEF